MKKARRFLKTRNTDLLAIYLICDRLSLVCVVLAILYVNKVEKQCFIMVSLKSKQCVPW